MQLANFQISKTVSAEIPNKQVKYARNDLRQSFVALTANELIEIVGGQRPPVEELDLARARSPLEVELDYCEALYIDRIQPVVSGMGIAALGSYRGLLGLLGLLGSD